MSDFGNSWLSPRERTHALITAAQARHPGLAEVADVLSHIQAKRYQRHRSSAPSFSAAAWLALFSILEDASTPEGIERLRAEAAPFRELMIDVEGEEEQAP